MSRPVRAPAVYCRISSDPKDERLGVARQEELCRDLVERKGWPAADVEVYCDNDTSAYSGKARPDYDRMIRDLEAGARDAVVCVDTDRLTRRPSELETFIALADRLGIPLANVSGELDLSTSDGRLQARSRGAWARYESEKKSERIRRQRVQAAQRGVPMGGPRPYGFEKDGKTVVPHEAKVIREAARRALGGESLTAIAKDLNARGVQAARGGEWGSPALRSALANPRYAGLRTHKGEVVGDATWPAILTREEHEQLRVVLGDPRRHKRGRPPAYLLTGLLRCSRCGGRMHHSTRSREDGAQRRYLCDSGPNRAGCGRTVIAAEAVEAHVAAAVLDALAGPPLAEAAGRRVGGSRVTADDLRVAELELEQVARDHGAGVISRAEWLAHREGVLGRINRLRAELARDADRGVLAGLPTTPEALRERWDAESTDWKRSVVQAIVERVVVHPGVQGRKPFDPGRVEIEWRA